jgi:hypothetical protein
MDKTKLSSAKKQKTNKSALDSYYRRRDVNDTLQKMRDRYHTKYAKDKEFNRVYGKYKYYKKSDRIDLFKDRDIEGYNYLVSSNRVKALRNQGSCVADASSGSPSSSDGNSSLGSSP